MMNYSGAAFPFPALSPFVPSMAPALSVYSSTPSRPYPGRLSPVYVQSNPMSASPRTGTPALPSRPVRPPAPNPVAPPTAQTGAPPSVIIQSLTPPPAASSKKHWMRFLTMTGSIVAGIGLAGYIGTRMFPKALVQEIGVHIKANILSGQEKEQLFARLKADPVVGPILRNQSIWGEESRQKEALKHVAASDIATIFMGSLLKKTLQSSQTHAEFQKALKSTLTPAFVRDCMKDAGVSDRIAESFEEAKLDKIAQAAMQKVMSDPEFLKNTAVGVQEILRQSLPWGSRLMPKK